jgi:membrane protein required for beta-lactamase induction
MDETAPSTSIGRRLIAIVVLIVAVWFLLKWAIGLIMGVATLIAIVLAIGAVIWALRTL